MKTIRELLVAVFLALGMVSLASAQITTTSTTLSAAVTNTSTTSLSVASATGFIAGTTSMFVDREFMDVVSVSGTRIGVRRGAGGIPSAHASATTVWVGPRGVGPFMASDKAGSCTATDEAYLIQINVGTGNRFDCTASLWTITGGPATSITGLSSLSSTGNIVTTTGIFASGTAGSSVGKLQMFNATSGSVTIAPTTGALGTVQATFPAAAITVPGSVFTSCGTSAACSPTTQSSTVKIAYGSVALVSASPSAATVTGISPAFTSTATYFCTATPVGNTAAIAAGGIAVTLVSGSSITLTGPNTVTTVIDWVCYGT